MMRKDSYVRSRVKVHVRVRPPLPRELDKDNKFHSCIGVGSTTEKGQTIFVSCNDSPILLSKEGNGAGEKNLERYTFDTVFPGSASQELVYQTSTEPIVASVLAGYNASVLAYGQTGAGKTYTMVGEEGPKEGITSRALRQIFETKGVKVTMSVLQIYKESLVDLLSCSCPPCDAYVRQVNGDVHIDNLGQHEVFSRKEGIELLETAVSRRAVGGTLLNEVSSRSHMIITINVTNKKSHGKLNLVDLAGSERLKDSGAEGVRLQETCAINSSLFALVAVVESLSSRSKFVPYRNSKLTMVLSDSLGGNCLTTVLVNVSPSQKFGTETLSSLKFAHSCKRIEKIVVRNQDKAQRPATAPAPVMILPWANDTPDVTSEVIKTKLGPVCCYYSGDPEGPPIVLLHGSPSSFGEFEHFLPALSYIGYRVIGVDQPGYGASPGERFPSRSDKAAKKGGPVDVLKEVLRHHKLEEASLLGYDWGGGIALTFGILYPKKVTKIVSFLPSFSETDSVKLTDLKVPTMIEWVRQDQNHSWRRFKPLADKIRKAVVEVINVPSSDREFARGCYEQFSGQVVQPIIKFLSGQDVAQATKKVYNAAERKTLATDGKQVVEVSNVNFKEDLSEANIEEMLSVPRPGVNAILLFEKLGKRYGYKEVYKADENQTHDLHRKVATVLRSLPTLSPEFLSKDPEAVVRLGLWKGLGQGFYEMLATPRYFKGRQVLIKTIKSDPDEILDPREKPDEKPVTQLGKIVEVMDDVIKVELEKDGGEGQIVDVTRKQIIQLNHPHKFTVDLASRLVLEDGIRCDYNNRIVCAKLVEICLSLAPVVERLDFFSPDCQEVQLEAVRTIRSCLDIVTFQVGLDRSRAARTDCAGKLATNGQAHCHGVSSTMAAFLLPLSTLLGLDLKYRGVYTFSGPKGVTVSDVERHQCLEISLRPSGSSWITDLWLTETYDNPAWLTMDVNTAYYRFMYPNGKFILNTKPENVNKTDFMETQNE